ncbi:MAG: Fic family protein [Candidatus Aenigmarchaeota archaeon]|nr:Fic family protein [Candidatus Aenigmarchaeota archaeon]
MVYHEVQKKGRKSYNYLVKSIRRGNKWEKKRKYIGAGKFSGDKIREEKEKFENELREASYLADMQKEAIENIKLRFESYLKKGGKSGVENFREWFFTDLTYNSNSIEGNSLSKRDTSLIINEGIVPRGASLREVNEAKNHKDALDFLLGYQGEVNEELMLKLHSIILKNIDDASAGKYRKVPVFVMGSDIRFPHHSKVPHLARNLIKWHKSNKKSMHPFELATLFSAKFVSIHPFTDGNGRCSRLLMNYTLKKSGYPEINIYVKDRNNYLKAVRKANDEDYAMLVDFLFRTLKKNYKFLAEM